ncbi:LCP family protein [Microbacterium sp. SORGH_AS_0888]|uniref:LCP family protein n=1 Tax=Microbacterium sp. SORGH_AS_0888 TaxID=3041791 RepID=UPI00278861AB|nr:LCP family protein [Microbacterium sp. SORGH_AS_0888]MDQ1130374.1 LCP family protein required for cell wall assembly [Microbacterium sp. SORGH_AS_0888]
MSPSHRNGRRQTVARHGQLRSPHPVSQIFTVLAVAVAVVLVAGVGVVGYNFWSAASTLASNSVELEGQTAAPPNIGAIEGDFNILLVGTDACEPAYAHYFPGRCDGPDAEGELNDVNIMIHVSDNPRRVTAVSFPRDLMIPIPSCTREDGSTSSAASKQQLNVSYGYGGLSCVAKTISKLTGQNIDYAAKITWGGVIEITNAIGGVNVCVANGIYDPDNTGLDLAPGEHTLKGVEALEFLRTRHGVGDGSDLGRISNQQLYMSNLVKKIVSDDTLSNVGTVYSLANTIVDNVTPSSNLANPLTLVQLALTMKGVSFSDIVFVQYPTGTDPDNAAKVVPNTSAASELFDALEANQQLILTGGTSPNSSSAGTIVIDPTPAPTDAPTPSTPTDTATPTDAATLPSSITGQTAAEQTCSNGNAG